MGLKFNILIMRSVGKAAEQLELLCTAGGNKIIQHCVRQFGSLLKVKLVPAM